MRFFLLFRRLGRLCGLGLGVVSGRFRLGRLSRCLDSDLLPPVYQKAERVISDINYLFHHLRLVDHDSTYARAHRALATGSAAVTGSATVTGLAAGHGLGHD